MSLTLYFTFMAAAVVLILIPGPNVALIVANSVAYGRRYGLLTVAGTSSAMFIQLALTVFGMTTLLSVIAGWFEWLRWIGVTYLVYLGVKAWRAPPIDLTKAEPQSHSALTVYLRGFLGRVDSFYPEPCGCGA
jgi:homoserine/homoserine lactone efflux protein